MEFQQLNRHNPPDGPRYKALGNSMPVTVMRRIGARIKQTKWKLTDD